MTTTLRTTPTTTLLDTFDDCFFRFIRNLRLSFQTVQDFPTTVHTA